MRTRWILACVALVAACTRDSKGMMQGAPDLARPPARPDLAAPPDLPAQPDLAVPVRRVFVTSNRFTGDLGGLSAADAKCQTAADSASLGGVWKAWLSTGSVNAIDRVARDGALYLVDGRTKVADSVGALATTLPLARINMFEDGKIYSDATPRFVWTGSGNDGALFKDGTGAPESCMGGSSGHTNATDKWMRDLSYTCDQLQSIYCIEGAR